MKIFSRDRIHRIRILVRLVVIALSSIGAFLLWYLFRSNDQQGHIAPLPIVFIGSCVAVAAGYIADLLRIHLERKALGDTTDVPKELRDSATLQAFRSGYYRRNTKVDIDLVEGKAGSRNLEFSTSSTISAFREVNMHAPVVRFPTKQLESKLVKNAKTIVLENPNTIYSQNGNPIPTSNGGILVDHNADKAECLRIFAEAEMPQSRFVIEDIHEWSSPVIGGFTLKAKLPIGYAITIFLPSRSDERSILKPEKVSESSVSNSAEYFLECPDVLFSYQGFGWCISYVDTPGRTE